MELLELDRKGIGTARELVQLALRTAQPGETISIKATITAVRELAGHLRDTDDQLTEVIVFEAIFLGAFIIFDLHE
ncbi:hypothetical protein DPM35_30010 [Mesorhizobium atlanticum]|uniref:Uncharacterized protein n=1 Tax=Mesorhizobium atlanticum TaxID=2233532 RepID=A0A330GK15_9HYPH|nr:hypothetical protein DPM35_30010 [Mesorhizobium atlanticum]